MNESMIAGIVDLIRSKSLADLKPEDEQCRACITKANKKVSHSGGAIQHCQFYGPHIGSRYGEVSPRLVLVGLENPDCSKEPDFEIRMKKISGWLEDLKNPRKGDCSAHRQGELAFIRKMFPSAALPYAHVATVNQHLHGLHLNRESKSSGLPSCLYAADILRRLRPQIIVIEKRRGWQPAGPGWGKWTHRKTISDGKWFSAEVKTTDLDGASVALVLASHPARPRPWTAENGYRDRILVPAVREAIQLVGG